MKIYFVTVNYNNSKVTEEYIKNINELKASEEVHIVVVDNNSVVEDYKNLENVCKEYSNVKLIRNEKNIGYFAGLNTGLTYVNEMTKENKQVVIGNNDLIFDKDFIEVIENYKLDSDILALAPNVVTSDGIFQNPHVISRVSKIRKLFFSIYYSNYYLGTLMMKSYKMFKKETKQTEVTEEMDIYMGIGAIYVLTNNFFKHYKLLDASVFLWGEEALLGNQIKQVKGRMRYLPNLKVKHLESLTTKKIPNKIKYNQAKKSYPIYKDYL
ncbi:glycosyltransferase [Clostridium sp. UBA4548]|uniref:glycosyltransferase n=1 Tax=Clostridium sp. UBA4548 TaxID=1946361 RepID=UPI0025C430D6|nr:glycosyltransferase [Clostridium sp. UBA4548]